MVILGSILRLYPIFQGFISILLLLLILHFGTAADAAIKRSKDRGWASNGLLKLAFATVFFLLTVTGFSNSGAMMGFDRVSMAVRVMEPEIIQGEQLLVDTWAYKFEKPGRGDIIIHSFRGQMGLFLNRIIAVPGDTIEIIKGKVFINGMLKAEDYVRTANVTKQESREMHSVVVPMNGYFVMGDNRDKSLGDSRFSGPIHLKDVKGMVRYILYSEELSRIGKRLE
jgi:signal peptidase I